MTAPCGSRGSWSSPGLNANGVCTRYRSTVSSPSLTRLACNADLTRSGRWLLFHSLVVTNSSSRRTVPSANNSLSAAPTSASLRYRSAASRWRKPTLTAALTASRVLVRSDSDVPNPSAGIAPLPLFNANVTRLRSSVDAITLGLLHFIDDQSSTQHPLTGYHS